MKPLERRVAELERKAKAKAKAKGYICLDPLSEAAQAELEAAMVDGKLDVKRLSTQAITEILSARDKAIAQGYDRLHAHQ